MAALGRSAHIVSIRAARVGGDLSAARSRRLLSCFNPRRPRGRRPAAAHQCPRLIEFQSAPPAWAATWRSSSSRSVSAVSIRAARVGGDRPMMWMRRGECSFNPRRPRGRRRQSSLVRARFGSVSIRAARVGGDPGTPAPARAHRCFNPRRPRGRRRGCASAAVGALLFQSAPPAWAATCHEGFVRRRGVVSIRAARVGGDGTWFWWRGLRACFNPRRPRGRRPASPRSSARKSCFNPRRPRGRRQGQGVCQSDREEVSIRAARVGGDWWRAG